VVSTQSTTRQMVRFFFFFFCKHKHNICGDHTLCHAASPRPSHSVSFIKICFQNTEMRDEMKLEQFRVYSDADVYSDVFAPLTHEDQLDFYIRVLSMSDVRALKCVVVCCVEQTNRSSVMQ
jgi:hypothetical protein